MRAKIYRLSWALLLFAATLITSCDRDFDVDDHIKVYPDFTITSFSPTTGCADTPITFTGSNFGDYAKAIKADFGGVEATTIEIVSDSEITVYVPEDAGDGKISLSVWTHTHETVEDFVYVPGPKIYGISETQGYAGDILTMTGLRFGDDINDVQILFAGDVEATIQSVTDSEIVFVVPADGESGAITLLIEGFFPITGPSFYYPISNVFEFDTAGDAEGWYAATTSVKASLSVAGDGVLKVQYDMVYGSSSTSDYNRVDLTYNDLLVDPGTLPILAIKWKNAPTYRTFSLRSSLGYYLNEGINGTGKYEGMLYDDGYYIYYYDLRNGFVSSDYDITQPVTISTLYWMVTATDMVEEANGTDSSEIDWIRDFTSVEALAAFVGGEIIVDPPVVTLVEEEQLAAGESITITGSNFGDDIAINDVVVMFGEVAATVTSASDTEIVATVPAGATDGCSVTVKIGENDAQTAVTSFSYPPTDPTITGISTSLASEGDEISIYGLNFGTTIGDVTVKFGSVTATVTSVEDDEIKVTVPAGVSDGCAVTVTITGYGETLTASESFSIYTGANYGINYVFNIADDLQGWHGYTYGNLTATADGIVGITSHKSTARIDIFHNSISFDVDKYPILAIRVKDFEEGKTFRLRDNSIGDFKGSSSDNSDETITVTEDGSVVKYFDLSKSGFGSSGTMVTGTYTFSSSGLGWYIYRTYVTDTITVKWVKSFESVDALNAFLELGY